MRYDARTVFAAALDWWRRQPESEMDFSAVTQARHAIRLRIYVQGDDEGHFLLNGADKVYWEPEDAEGFRNTDQTLADEAEKLGHVILSTMVTRQERFWPTWAAFAEEVGLAQL